MDPKLLFWAAALVDLGALCAVALFGVRCARRGEIARHRRAMKIASLLVLGFLVAYGLKIQLLGREDMAVWSTLDVWVLRIHELFVLQMLGGGTIAWLQARKLVGSRLVTHDPADPIPDPRTCRIHRIAGRTAVVGATLAFVGAIAVFAGMVGRTATS
jgi:uncharacterized membrane protein